MQEMKEYRVGRNFIRVGDRVKVTTPGKYPFEGIVQKIKGDGVEAAELDVVVARTKVKGTAQGKAGQYRTVLASRVERMAQTKQGKKRLSA